MIKRLLQHVVLDILIPSKKAMLGFFPTYMGSKKKLNFHSNISGSGAVFPFYKVLFVSALINRIWVRVRVRREKDTLEELQVTK